MLKQNIKQYIEYIRLLRRHQKLSAKRHPAFEQNKTAKFFIYLSAGITIIYLMFFAVIFAMVANSSNSTTACELIYGFAPFILTIDFLFRFIAQQTPSQMIKPYILLPIPKKLCIDSFISSSMFDWGNCIWFAMFIPYTIMSVVFSEGIFITFLFLLSLYILILINSQWYSIVRALINRNILWWILPLLVYALIFSPWYIGKNANFSTLCDTYAELGSLFVEPKLFMWLLLFAGFVLILYVNRRIQFVSVWQELAKVETTKLKHVSQFNFLNKYGIIGEYVKLEIKSTMRNKNIRKSFIFANIFILIISLIIAFTDIYDSQFMNYFWSVYCFSLYGAMILVKTMCAEGNYIDGLMVHRENIFALLTAKYYFFTILLLVPFILMLPTVFMGKYSLLMLFSMMFFTGGVSYCLFMQLSVYNKQTIPLNTKFIGKGSMENNYLQVVFELVAFFVPILLLHILYIIFNAQISYIIFLLVGFIFILGHRIWLKNIYNRLMKHRYDNIEGFRASR